MSRSGPPSRPGSSSSSRPSTHHDPDASSPDYSGAFGLGGTAYLKTREYASAPPSRNSTPQPLHATPGVKFTQAKPRAHHVGGAVVSDLLGGKAKPFKPDFNGKKPEKRSEKAEALETKIRDVESVVFDEHGASSSATPQAVTLGRRAMKKGKGGCFCQGELDPSSFPLLCFV